MINELTKAIQRGDIPFVTEYVKNDLPINEHNVEGSTPLHEAVLLADSDTVELLITYGANPNVLDSFGNTPLHLAALYGEYIKARLLLDAGAVLDASSQQQSWTPLMLAISGKHEDLAHFFIDQQADIHFVEPQKGWSPLLAACEQSLTEVAIRIISMGADIHHAVREGDCKGRNPLVLISYYGNIEVSMALLEKGAHIDYQPEGRWLSALHWSVYNGHFGLMKKLVEKGANVNLQAKGIYYDRSPLHYAVCGGWEKMAAFLLANGADPYLPDEEGRCALIMADDKKEIRHNRERFDRIITLLQQYA